MRLSKKKKKQIISNGTNAKRCSVPSTRLIVSAQTMHTNKWVSASVFIVMYIIYALLKASTTVASHTHAIMFIWIRFLREASDAFFCGPIDRYVILYMDEDTGMSILYNMHSIFRGIFIYPLGTGNVAVARKIKRDSMRFILALIRMGGGGGVGTVCWKARGINRYCCSHALSVIEASLYFLCRCRLRDRQHLTAFHPY